MTRHIYGTPGHFRGQDAEFRELQELNALGADRTDAQSMRRDLLLYGVSFGRRRPDGALEHIPAVDMVVEHRTVTLPTASSLSK